MLNLLIWAGIAFKNLHDVAGAFKPVRRAEKIYRWFDDLERGVERRTVKRERALGLNRLEDEVQFKTTGTISPFFPALIQEDMLPEELAPEDRAALVGRYVFRVREWNALMTWIVGRARMAQGDVSVREVANGPWLLRIGRARWRDADLRTKAFENTVHYSEMWKSSEMWMEQES